MASLPGCAYRARHEPLHPGHEGHESHFWRHFVGMLVAMAIGMFVGAAIFHTVLGMTWEEALLMLAHGVVLFGSEWVDPPRILGNIYFYMTLEAQFALAIMLGVALASGFEGKEGRL